MSRVHAHLLEGYNIPVVADQRLLYCNENTGILAIELKLIFFLVFQYVKVVCTQATTADVEIDVFDRILCGVGDAMQVALRILRKTVSNG